jgi:hypothetical protein
MRYIVVLLMLLAMGNNAIGESDDEDVSFTFRLLARVRADENDNARSYSQYDTTDIMILMQSIL